MIETNAASQMQETYPPFDLIQLGDNDYRINLAVAGSSGTKSAQQNVLIVAGAKREEDGLDYVHRGIATRSFERRFALADHIQVRGADLRDGLLSVELVREIPEAMKPRKVDIGTGSSQTTIDDRTARPKKQRETENV